MSERRRKIIEAILDDTVNSIRETLKKKKTMDIEIIRVLAQITSIEKDLKELGQKDLPLDTEARELSIEDLNKLAKGEE